MNTTSTLAATICSSVTCPAVRRENFDRREILLGTLADHHPVADRRQFGAAAGAMLEAAGGDRVELAAIDVDAEDLVELDGDARRMEIVRFPAKAGADLREMARERLVPPEPGQLHRLNDYAGRPRIHPAIRSARPS
jgi:hypothetical protein